MALERPPSSKWNPWPVAGPSSRPRGFISIKEGHVCSPALYSQQDEVTFNSAMCREVYQTFGNDFIIMAQQVMEKHGFSSWYHNEFQAVIPPVIVQRSIIIRQELEFVRPVLSIIENWTADSEQAWERSSRRLGLIST
ncbi:Fc.00g012800.m01.CDS01 [Cosmosporella sp. VM-42]